MIQCPYCKVKLLKANISAEIDFMNGVFNMIDRSPRLNRIITICFPILVIIFFITGDYFVDLLSKLPPCIFYTELHLYCPACGNTRSVTALLHGDLLSAMRYNISPIVFGIFILMAYIEIASTTLGKPIRLLPRKLRYYVIILLLLILYVSIRNFIPNMT